MVAWLGKQQDFSKWIRAGSATSEAVWDTGAGRGESVGLRKKTRDLGRVGNLENAVKVGTDERRGSAPRPPTEGNRNLLTRLGSSR